VIVDAARAGQIARTLQLEARVVERLSRARIVRELFGGVLLRLGGAVMIVLTR